MQAEIVNKKPEFEPMTIAVTFETAEELLVFYRLMGSDVSVPKTLYGDDDDKRRKLLSSMMMNIYNLVKNEANKLYKF